MSRNGAGSRTRPKAITIAEDGDTYLKFRTDAEHQVLRVSSAVICKASPALALAITSGIQSKVEVTSQEDGTRVVEFKCDDRWAMAYICHVLHGTLQRYQKPEKSWMEKAVILHVHKWDLADAMRRWSNDWFNGLREVSWIERNWVKMLGMSYVLDQHRFFNLATKHIVYGAGDLPAVPPRDLLVRIVPPKLFGKVSPPCFPLQAELD
jgi:hypothetical protein